MSHCWRNALVQESSSHLLLWNFVCLSLLPRVLFIISIDIFSTMFQSGWRADKLPAGWSRYPVEDNISSKMMNIANYNQEQVGFQNPRPNNTYQNYRRQNFHPRQNNGFQNKRFFNRNRSNGRIRKSLEGQWRAPNLNQNHSESQQPARKQETPTQTVINGQSNENCKKICIRIVGQIRKLKQDHEILNKKEELFKDREDRVLKELKDIQTREEIEDKIINMITLNRIFFNEVRLATNKIAKERSEQVKQEAHDDLLLLREETQDESATLLIRAQAQALKSDVDTILSWVGFSCLDELRGHEEQTEYNRMEMRLQAISRPLTNTCLNPVLYLWAD